MIGAMGSVGGVMATTVSAGPGLVKLKRFVYHRTMDVTPDVGWIGVLIGEPSRARMLHALMDGRAKTAKELALEAGVTPPTASTHLAKLVEAGLLAVEAQSRHRYFRLASAGASQAVEALMALAPPRPAAERRAAEALDGIRAARMCYDHLAGRAGVAITEALVGRRWLQPVGRDFRLTAAGETALAKLGVDVAGARGQRRAFARQCLDWTERRMHLAGALGAALAHRLVDLGWLRRAREGRAVVVTERGRQALVRTLSLKAF